MRPPHLSLLTRTISLLLIAAGLHAHAELLYFTDFDEFPVGDNRWAGHDGWRSNDLSSGVQAIDDSVLSGGLGHVAALGFRRPSSGFTTIFRSINYDPTSGDSPLVEINTLLGIEDSTQLTNFRRDDFFLSFYNMEGDLLASLRFSNTDRHYGIWRRDGSLRFGGREHEADFDFIQGELHELSVRIDLRRNIWTALLDGIPLFDEVTFNRTGLTRTLGPVAFEWEIAAGHPSDYGDNWLLVADLRVQTIDLTPPPLRFDSIDFGKTGALLSWETGPGFAYRVHVSPDGRNWKPMGSAHSSLFPQFLSVIDPGSTSYRHRFYRLSRTPLP